MQKQNKRMIVPSELMHPFFFSEKEILVGFDDKNIDMSQNFTYEILYYSGEAATYPWEQPEVVFPVVIQKWDALRIHLEQMYSIRNPSSVLDSMKKGIGLFIQLLFWTNEEAVNLQKMEMIANFAYKPVNITERLNFLLSRPALYHSFIQLGELFKEQEKQFVIKTIRKNASRK